MSRSTLQQGRPHARGLDLPLLVLLLFSSFPSFKLDLHFLVVLLRLNDKEQFLAQSKHFETGKPHFQPNSGSFCILRVCIGRFNQSWMENTLEKMSPLKMYRLFSCHYSLKIQYNSYLYSIYFVLGIVSHLELTWSIWNEMYQLYANTTPFSIMDLNI